MSDAQAPWVVWGSELSPFTLKVIRLLRHARLPFRLLPTDGGGSEGWRCALRVERLKRGRLALTWPRMTEDDEFPLVPFVFGADGTNLYDSSAIAEWLDRGLPPERRVIPDDPLAAFVARLIDDYADEFLLYVVHHNRWVVSARDNDAGRRLAHEYRRALGPFQPLFARWFSARQVRRLPYLFSVAPAGFHVAALPRSRQPPARAGFPPTHALLEQAFVRLLDILETLLARQPFILGGRFTLADAALYGQLGMNLPDPSAGRIIRERAPRLHRWLTTLHGVEPAPLAGDGALQVDAALQPLLAELARIHVPLMKQNAAAHARLRAQGQRRFNEAAFERGEALYDGVLDGRPWRAVAKSFQARVWRDCVAHWQVLPEAARAQFRALQPFEP